MKETFKELTLTELAAKRDELKKKYFKLRFDMVMGHVENPLEKRVLRRKIARLNTLVHNKSGK
jgi:large subunit ribosomal protein L29